MTKDVNFQTLRRANILRQDEWDGDKKIDAAYRAMELGGEVGEALNVVKKLVREERGIAGSRASLNDLGEELADVIICVDLLAYHYGINLADAVKTKFNKTSEKVGLETRIGE